MELSDGTNTDLCHAIFSSRIDSSISPRQIDMIFVKINDEKLKNFNFQRLV